MKMDQTIVNWMMWLSLFMGKPETKKDD